MEKEIVNLTYSVEKETKNTIKFIPDSTDPAFAGSSLYLQKDIVKKHGFEKGFKMRLEAK